MTEPAPQLALLVAIDDPTKPSQYYRAELAPVTMAADGTPRNISEPYGRPDAVERLADLVIGAQVSADEPDGTWYGWSVEYRRPYTVGLHRAEAMAATLRAISRHQDRLTARYGWPDTFAAYAARIADALHITAYCIPVRRAAYYPDGEYRLTDAPGAATYIAAQLAEYRAQRAPSSVR